MLILNLCTYRHWDKRANESGILARSKLKRLLEGDLNVPPPQTLPRTELYSVFISTDFTTISKNHHFSFANIYLMFQPGVYFFHLFGTCRERPWCVWSMKWHEDRTRKQLCEFERNFFFVIAELDENDNDPTHDKTETITVLDATSTQVQDPLGRAIEY